MISLRAFLLMKFYLDSRYMRFSLCLLAFVTATQIQSTLVASPRVDSLLTVLDKSIENESIYNSIKIDRINKLTQQLQNKYLPKEEQYNLYRDLSKEYDAYNFDSAKVYVLKGVEMAHSLRKPMLIQESNIQLGLINARAGNFSQAFEILNSIDKSNLAPDHLALYYKTFVETYIYQLEYLEGSNLDPLIKNRDAYLDSLLSVSPITIYNYVVNFSIKCIENHEFDKSEKILFTQLAQLTANTREYSVLTSIIAYHFQLKGYPELQKEYLTLSAISDIRGAVKETNSLRVLAILLYEDGQFDRANRYIKKSLEDANFYHARLRNIQTAKVLPIIDKAFQNDREAHEKKLTMLLLIVSLLSVVLMLAIFLVFKQKQKVSKARNEILEINSKLNELNDNLQHANEIQKKTNQSLAEANLIKEQYIGSFLEITTEYIDKFDSFKTMINRKIMAGQKSDILRLTAESEDSIRDLKKLYENFDKAFLNIYPNFVEELNKLLRKEEHYPITVNTLNQELRIFALIRLGITDSHKMATFLHYSLRTIYNYRSKVKSKAIYQDDNFEERVKLLCSMNL